MFISFNTLLLHLIKIALSFFIILAFAIPIITLFLSYKRNRIENHKKKIYEKYENEIFSFLYYDDNKKFNLDLLKERLGKIQKKYFVDILNELSKYIKLGEQIKIRQLVIAYDLEKYLLKKICWAFSLQKTQSLQMLVNIGCTEKSYSVLQKLCNSKNVEKRLYAIENLIIYGSFNVERDFLNYKYSLSLWEQMNYYYLIFNKLKKTPDFKTLLYSSNNTIILFGLRMMRLFNQSLNLTEEYKQIFTTQDTQIQVELYRLLATNKKFDINEEPIPTVEIFRLEDMLSNYARLYYVTTEMMIDIYKHTENVILKKHILICIYDYVKNGKKDIEYLANQDKNDPLNKMCRSLIEKQNDKDIF